MPQALFRKVVFRVLLKLIVEYYSYMELFNNLEGLGGWRFMKFLFIIKLVMLVVQIVPRKETVQFVVSIRYNKFELP